MRMERRYSAERVASVALGCAVIVWLAVAATALPDPFPHSIGGRYDGIGYYLALFAVAVVTAIGMYIALAAFKRGVADEVWPPASLEGLRAQLERPVWSAVVVVLVFAGIGYVFYDVLNYKFGSQHHHFNGGLIYFWLSPIIAFGQLRAALKPPRPTGAGTSIWLGDVKPMQSDHWGGR